MENSLFRKEVILNKQFKHLGAIFINMPLSFAGTCLGSVVSMGIFLSVIYFGTFTEQWYVRGYINTAQGIIHTYVKSPGLIRKVYVREGQHVHRGDALFRVDLLNHQKLETQQINQSYEAQKNLLQQALNQKQQYLRQLKPLLEKKYIATTFYAAKQDEILALKNQVHTLEIDFLRNKQARAVIIRAPIEGKISNLLSFEGQYVQPDKPLASILPIHATYIAQLYIPVPQSGFIKPNDKTVLRYDAYPYQRFGVAEALIKTISQTVLTDTTEEKPISIQQPYYKAIAALDKPYVLAYNKPHYLHQGMTFTAIIQGEKKRIWQWLLDPLYSCEQCDHEKTTV